jgi:hypothetical protein
MKYLVAVALLFGCLTLSTRAQNAPSPEALRAAQDLAAVVTADTIQQMTNGMIGQMWPGLEAQLGPKVDAATLAEMRTETERAIASFTGDLMKDAPAIYARYFSADELREISAFYKSPTGVKALHTMPKVMADVTGLLVPRMPTFQRDLGGRLEATMRKHGYKQ